MPHARPPDRILPAFERGRRGTVRRTYRWRGVDGPARVALPLPTDLVRYFASFPRQASISDQLRTFPTDPLTREVFEGYVSLFRETLEGHPGDEELARQLIRFVQCTPYRRAGDIQQTPLETLAHREGDCSDQSVLLAGLLHAIDHPCVILLYEPTPTWEGHAAVGVADLKPEVANPSYHEHGGRRYYYVETTNELPIGRKSSVARSRAKVLPVAPRAALSLTYRWRSLNRDVNVKVRVANLGSEPARAVEVDVRMGGDGGTVWDTAGRWIDTIDVYDDRVVSVDLEGPHRSFEPDVSVRVDAANAAPRELG